MLAVMANSQARSSTNVQGILTMLAAVASFAVMDACIKRLVETYPAIQVTFLRGVASLPFLLGSVAVFGRWRDFIPQRWMLHVVRGVLAFIVLWLFVFSVKFLSLGDAYAIFMSAPLLITALSVPMLGERVGWRRWAAVLVGLAGVMVMLKPSSGGWISIGGLAALAAAFGYAVNAITIRILRHSDTGAATILWSLLVMTTLSGLGALPSWTDVHWNHFGWILIMGIAGALGQHFITSAFRCAAPSVIAPLEYTALAWAMVFDYVIWLVVPTAQMLVGATIIVASGIYVFRREKQSVQQRLGGRATDTEPPSVVVQSSATKDG
jgi:drug/metabolite transporter (DMT)-like permease